ncbi:sodium/hydrogen antiporter nha1 [Apiospora rasikravindrae]|uniref:Sodium/hydrogen antiporter nha1 n=1 Tax=Apiospora rasikravindrae TaxID=990691 RepID=A0ABR1RXE5_9PEZI
MTWDHLSVTKSHLVYIILGGFTSLFMLCSTIIKERMYIGEATVATLCGLIFGPHAANLINPQTWGNTDEVTLEFSRIVLVVQCFAVGVELPKFYMEKHWRSVVLLLLPVMTFGWLITSLFIWWLIPPLNWLESLCVAACVTATDPVLASSVVGKGKFAKRVPKHLRDLLSAESGCNDGMAFPFIYLALYLIQDHLDARETTYHWIVYTILYECVFGAIYGFLVGYIARHGIKFAEKRDLIDRESFLVFYFVLALFCAGSGSILGVDDLLVGFAAGVGFSNDGWFSSKTEESHVSNVIDLLLNLTYFVYFGTIIPWEQFNNVAMGLSAGKLVAISILVIFFRRIPVMLALKPFIPDVKTWREALFAGHFGPIGVGAIFVAILARAELETEHTIPLAELPPEGTPHHALITLVWPIVTFIVVSSIIVHGSSIAVFTLGKRINTLSLTMSYTAAPEDGPSWMNRLPRISSQSRSQARTMSDTEGDDMKLPEFPPGTLPPTGLPGQFLRRKKDEDRGRSGSRASSHGRRRRKVWDDGIGPGGPVSESAIFPQRRSRSDFEPMSPGTESQQQEQFEEKDPSGTLAGDESSGDLREKGSENSEKEAEKAEKKHAARVERDADGEDERNKSQPEIGVYHEGHHIVIEDEDGQVLAVEETQGEHHPGVSNLHDLKEMAQEETQKGNWTYESLKKRVGEWRNEEAQKRKGKTSSQRRHEPARAYQFGNTIIVEDEDGEVVKKYELPSSKAQNPEASSKASSSLKYMGLGKKGEKAIKESQKESGESSGEGSSSAGPSRPPAKSGNAKPGFSGWAGKKNAAANPEVADEDDRKIRFTIGGEGRRMTKDDFLREVQKLDAQTRREVIRESDASPAMKALAKEQAQAGTAGPAAAGSLRPSVKTGDGDNARQQTKAPAKPQEEARGRTGPAKSQAASGTGGDGAGGGETSSDQPETAAEKRRRMAALSTIQDDDDVAEKETPAERRRREAALGLGETRREDSDSDDDDTPRVPPARRGIRFAEPSPRQ